MSIFHTPNRLPPLRCQEHDYAQDDLRQPAGRRRCGIDGVLPGDRLPEERAIQQRAGIVDGLVGRDLCHAAGQAFFATFTDKTIADATTITTGHYALSFDSRDAVDEITQAAIEAGGRELHEPQDMGFMYSRAFEDLDGHGFGPFWMNPAAAEGGPPDHA